jgi:hypothetical protein
MSDRVYYTHRTLRYYDSQDNHDDLVECVTHTANSDLPISKYKYSSIVDYWLTQAQEEKEVICITFRNNDQRLILDAKSLVLDKLSFTNVFTKETYEYTDVIEYVSIHSTDTLLRMIETYNTKVFLDNFRDRSFSQHYYIVSWKQLDVIS